jgi:hypothetical protein
MKTRTLSHEFCAGKELEAVNQWNFQPAVKDGQPVKVATTIEVSFRLL